MKIYHSIITYINLSRPINVALSILSLLIAIAITRKPVTMEQILFASITAAFITAGANAINDFYDIEIDKINKPQRPLPSGKIKPVNAVIFAFVCFVIGFIPNFFLNKYNVIIAIFAITFLILYTPFFKKRFLIGNILIALISGLVFVYGAAVANQPKSGLYPAFIAFVIHFTREIIKDTEDLKGDRVNHSRTLPTIFPISITHKLIALLFILSSFIIMGAYLFDFFNQYYLWIVLIFVIPMYIYFSFIFMKTKSYDLQLYKKVSRWIKISMVFGILAFYLGT